MWRQRTNKRICKLKGDEIISAELCNGNLPDVRISDSRTHSESVEERPFGHGCRVGCHNRRRWTTSHVRTQMTGWRRRKGKLSIAMRDRETGRRRWRSPVAIGRALGNFIDWLLCIDDWHFFIRWQWPFTWKQVNRTTTTTTNWTDWVCHRNS